MVATSAHRAPPTPDLVVMDAQPGEFWFGAWHNVNVAVWIQGASVAAIGRLDRTNPARVRAHPEKISTVHIVLPDARPPEADARNALTDMHNRYGETVGCAAVVIERGGLLGSAVRGAVTGMTMLAPKHYRVKVFDTVEPVAPWLTENHARSTGVQLAESLVLSVLQYARTAGLL